MKLLITGASGLLGTKLCEIALRKNHEVYSVYSQHKPLYGTPVRLDILNLKAVRQTLDKTKPEAVVHAAALTDVDKCELEKELAWKTNVEGTRNIALSCSKANAKLVYISTDYVFDGEKGNYEEEDEPNPMDYYGVTKLEGEKQAIQHCKNYAILRTSVIYGWHPWKQNFVTWIVSQLRQNEEISVVEDHYNTPTLADNLAEMVLEALQRGLKGLYHASGSERISRYEFAKKIAESFQLDSSLIKPVRMSQLAAWIARRPRDSSLSTDKIRKQLRTRPLNITEGLNRMKTEEKT